MPAAPFNALPGPPPPPLPARTSTPRLAALVAGAESRNACAVPGVAPARSSAAANDTTPCSHSWRGSAAATTEIRTRRSTAQNGRPNAARKEESSDEPSSHGPSSSSSHPGGAGRGGWDGWRGRESPVQIFSTHAVIKTPTSRTGQISSNVSTRDRRKVQSQKDDVPSSLPSAASPVSFSGVVATLDGESDAQQGSSLFFSSAAQHVVVVADVSSLVADAKPSSFFSALRFRFLPPPVPTATPDATARTTLPTRRNAATLHPSIPTVTAALSSPADCAAVRKATTARRSAPAAIRPAARGRAPQEHRGVIRPRREAKRVRRTDSISRLPVPVPPPPGTSFVAEASSVVRRERMDPTGVLAAANSAVVIKPSSSHGHASVALEMTTV
mmetsp:Transcript_14446/g.42330  ORF Transcript_14446/g.42330 Transcript_14446/m.42330 type:complete len:386 (+) Transcript_14446:442-1599(+)